MVEERKKIITSTNKVLVILVVISWIIILILFISGFKKINPYILLVSFIAIAIFIFYNIRKNKRFDVYDLVNKVSNQHYQKYNQFVDTRDFQVVRVTPDSSLVYFPHNGLLFEFEGMLIKGVEFNHPYRFLRRQEKSKLFQKSIEFLGAESRLRHTAESLNIDLKSLGLE